jgi:prefoldin subunit 5
LQNNLTEEVVRLSRRADELEENLATLDARAQQLPVQISELQQSLATLQILTETLATSLRQVQKVLSYSALKTLSAARIGELLQLRPAPKNSPRSG